MDRIILIGAGGHARSCIDVIESSKKYVIAGFVDREHKGNDIPNYKVIGLDKDLKQLRTTIDCAFITIGQINSAKPRMKMFDALLKLDFHIPTIISPLSYVSKNSNVGEGTVIMHGAIVNANVNIGKNCIINSNSLIEHDTVIEDNCHISTGAILNGNVYIEEETFVGSGSIIKQNKSIAKRSFLKMGSIIK
jgi:sugar O-acyltransferase (sialic acid O-acetyltransferase NeuD family)